MNNDALELYSKEEIKTDIMRYRPNGASFWLCMLAVILNVSMFLIVYTNKACTTDWELGIDLLVNVMFMLAAFLTAEKTKAYNKSAGYVAIGLGAIQILRIFWIPLKYFNMWSAWKMESDLLTQQYLSEGKTLEQITGLLPKVTGLDGTQFTWCVALFAACCVALVIAGIIAILKSNKLKAHLAKLEERGN